MKQKQYLKRQWLNILKLIKDIKQRIPTRKNSIQRRKNTKNTASCHIIVTLQNIKDKKEILTSDKDDKNITFKVGIVELAAEFSTELMHTRNNRVTFQIAKDNNCQLKILYAIKVSKMKVK